MPRPMEWLWRLFRGPRQVVVEGEGTVDAHDLPCSSGSGLIQLQVLDNTSQISGTSEKRPLTDKPPYIPECEVFEEGDPEADEKFRSCDRHCEDGFIPVKDFTRDQMPEGFQDERSWKEFQAISARTVKLVVKYTSLHRPDTHPDSSAPYPYCTYRGKGRATRTGTGYIIGVIEREWKQKISSSFNVVGHSEYDYFTVLVVTATHVVFDKWEAKKTVCEVFYDDPDNKESVKLSRYKRADSDGFDDIKIRLHGSVSNVYKLHDMNNIKKRTKHDMFVMEFVSHNWVLYGKLRSVLQDMNPLICDIPVIVSHPHGASKMVSVGRTLPALQIPLPQTHTPDTPYTIRVNTRVETEIDLVTLYPGFFKKYPKDDTRYDTTRPIHLYILCDESNVAAFRWKDGSHGYYVLPEGSRLTSVDGETDIPYDGIGFNVYYLLKTLHHKDVSFYFVYDIHTCKGSSGARVGTGDFDSFDNFRCHYGKVEDGGDLNRTGMYTQLMRMLKEKEERSERICFVVVLLFLLAIITCIVVFEMVYKMEAKDPELHSNSSETVYNNQTITLTEINKQIG